MTLRNKQVDRRIKRSRRLMQDALLVLLDNKAYPQITISEITYQADVARTTFYSHFKTKDELLMSYIDDIFESFFDKFRQHFAPDELVDNTHQIPLILCEEWRQNKAALDIIRSANIDFMIYQRIKENHQRAFLDSSENLLGNSSNNILEQYIVSSISAATFGVLMQWTDNDMRESCEVIAKILNHFINLESFELLRDKLEIEIGIAVK